MFTPLWQVSRWVSGVTSAAAWVRTGARAAQWAQWAQWATGTEGIDARGAQRLTYIRDFTVSGMRPVRAS
jgi:hypothetical protein